MDDFHVKVEMWEALAILSFLITPAFLACFLIATAKIRIFFQLMILMIISLAISFASSYYIHGLLLSALGKTITGDPLRAQWKYVPQYFITSQVIALITGLIFLITRYDWSLTLTLSASISVLTPTFLLYFVERILLNPNNKDRKDFV